MSPSAAVLARYAGLAERCAWRPLSNAGGFSGAEVWRGDVAGVPQFALKRWPHEYPIARLRQIHSWMKLAAHLPFVPRLLATPNHWTTFTHDGFAWELAAWMPGEACRAALDEPQFRAAVTAIAQLLGVWRPDRPTLGPCPAVQRRLRLFAEWEAAERRGTSAGLRGEAAALVRAGLPVARQALLPWIDRPVPLQPCLCDVHRDHVLFTEAAVTGVIDYGAMKVDCVAVDAARYLGDATDTDAAFAAGAELFERLVGGTRCPPGLVAVLGATGTLGAVANVLMRGPGDPALDARLERHVARWRRLAAPGRPGRLEWVERLHRTESVREHCGGLPPL